MGGVTFQKDDVPGPGPEDGAHTLLAAGAARVLGHPDELEELIHGKA